MDRVNPFDSQHLEAACRVLADTEWGLKGSQIERLLQEIKVCDTSPLLTKWKRLFNALAEAQNKHKVGNHLIMFINRAMNPVSYARDKIAFEWRRDELNVVLAFSGFYIREDGKVCRSDKETTLSGARTRAGRLRSALTERCVHEEVLKYCRAELVEEDYSHAVLEATKGVGERIGRVNMRKALIILVPLIILAIALAGTHILVERLFILIMSVLLLSYLYARLMPGKLWREN